MDENDSLSLQEYNSLNKRFELVDKKSNETVHIPDQHENMQNLAEILMLS